MEPAGTASCPVVESFQLRGEPDEDGFLPRTGDELTADGKPADRGVRGHGDGREPGRWSAAPESDARTVLPKDFLGAMQYFAGCSRCPSSFRRRHHTDNLPRRIGPLVGFARPVIQEMLRSARISSAARRPDSAAPSMYPW
ncbi:hypothetical protein GCM10025787_25000 [Saccharopolyspora rosea]